MIILTGGAGFIGSCFLWKLNNMGIDDIIVVDRLDDDGKWKNLLGKKFSDYIDKDDFKDAIEKGEFKKAKYVVHMGACSSTTLSDSGYYMQNNYLYSVNLAKWTVSNNIPFMYASSAATYGDGGFGFKDDKDTAYKVRPLNMYGFSKSLFDIWMFKKNLENKITGFKFFNVFGPNEYHKGEMRSIVCKKFQELVEDGTMKLFKSYKSDYKNGGQKRDFVYIKDVVDVMFFFFNNPHKTGLYNLGTGKARSWNDLAGAMFKALGEKTKIKYVDMPEGLRNKYQYFTKADIDKLRQSGYTKEFSSLEESIKDYISYLKNGNYL